MIINSIVRELKANGDMSMDYLSHNVSENLKRIRQSKGMSLDQVAEQTGVSKSMLAQIEKGIANPSIGVLGKITSGLRIEFQRLIDPPRVDYALISPDDLVPTKELLDSTGYGPAFHTRTQGRSRYTVSTWSRAACIQAVGTARKHANILQSQTVC